MTPLRALYILAISILLLLVGVGSFNYLVDPQCFYNCPEVTLDRQTTNTYYQIAQSILRHPEAEVVVVGSSRGETTSPLWIEELTGQKTLNLSAAASEVFARSAFLAMALKKLNLKKVIWYADYFEMLGGLADQRILNSPALSQYLLNPPQQNFDLSQLQSLIDRKTLEASFKARTMTSADPILKGSDIDYQNCARADYPGRVSALKLSREIDLLYESYRRQFFRQVPDEKSWRVFNQVMDRLEGQGVDVLVVVAPYHPEFLHRLKSEEPEAYQHHLQWIARLKSREDEHFKVVDYFAGFPGDSGAPRFWDDGVHFNCHSVIEFIGPLLAKK